MVKMIRLVLTRTEVEKLAKKINAKNTAEVLVLKPISKGLVNWTGEFLLEDK